MKRNFYIVVITVLAFAFGYSVNNIAISENTAPRVAVVDVAQIVSNSSAVKALKAEQERKVVEMQSTLDRARADISRETDPAKIASLEEKYRKQINDQKLALDNDYNNKMSKIDSDIKAIIAAKSKSLNYDLVLPKNVVFFGGDDITGLVAKEVK